MGVEWIHSNFLINYHVSTTPDGKKTFEVVTSFLKEFPFTIEPKQLELEVGETKELSVSCFPVTWEQKKVVLPKKQVGNSEGTKFWLRCGCFEEVNFWR